MPREHPSIPLCPCATPAQLQGPASDPCVPSWPRAGGRGRGTSLPPRLVPPRRAQRVNDSHVKWLQMCGKVWGDRTAPLLTFTPPSLPLPPGAPRSTFHTRAGGGGEQSAWDGGGKRLGRGRQRDFILCCCLLPPPSTQTLRRGQGSAWRDTALSRGLRLSHHITAMPNLPGWLVADTGPELKPRALVEPPEEWKGLRAAAPALPASPLLLHGTCR